MRLLLLAIALMSALAACGGSDVDISDVPELAAISGDELIAQLTESNEPVVVNVWASWCVPCRSEAPLLERAARQSSVRFIGLNVRDDQQGARSFIAEFFPNAPIEHYMDTSGDIPVELGGTRGVPLTFFFAPGGELIKLHTGVIDERTLALQIDEIAGA
ncbi:MAG: thioredoxin domain-containing protein [Acidimicrobiia bacterium]|nr:thioredoxin domain-containing protein [Acidimicrobiia bacterium]